MTRRVFVSSLRTGLSSATKRVGPDGRPTFQPTVELVRRSGADESRHPFEGPDLAVIGPGDVVGIDRNQVVREEPPPGTVDAEDNNLVSLDLADATLPWLLTLPSMEGRPWIALVVLREDEGQIDTRGRIPSVTVPAHALPDPADLATWAHVEARIEPTEDLTAMLRAEARQGTDRVVGRLVCPRKLEPDRGWLACVVPTTRAGVRAALGGDAAGDPAAPAWTAGGGPATLPVYHSWSFRTGQAGSFEDLAVLVQPVTAEQMAGLGERLIDVRFPWPHADLLGPGTPDEVTMTYQGALKPPGSTPPSETWSHDAARLTFQQDLESVLDAEQADGQVSQEGIAPPLFGTHHTGHRQVPSTGWMRVLNLEVRHRLAASLGGRYVQVEQEFLMERAWEQVGAIREANRFRAQAELAAHAAAIAQAKHLDPMQPDELTGLVDPITTTQTLTVQDRSLGDVLARSAVPEGTASTAFKRLSRKGGAMARRTRRAAGDNAEALATPSVVIEGLAGAEVVPTQPMAAFIAGGQTTSPLVAMDDAARYGAGAMIGLVVAQDVAFSAHAVEAGSTLGNVLGTMTGAMTDLEMVSVVAPGELRDLRRGVLGFPGFELASVEFEHFEAGAVASDILADLVALPKQLSRVAERVEVTGVPTVVDPPRPLRPIMAHPRFAFPVAAELMSKWPDWTVPGITVFPENRCALLETNSPFVEAVLVGLNQEFNRELLWREYPTDQAGTPFARFWPGGADVYDEIAHWSDDEDLGDHDPVSPGEVPGEEDLVLLVRADVLRRYPGSMLLAVQAGAPGVVPETGGTWKEPHFLLPVDDRTCLFGFDLSMTRALAERWLFVLREPMRGTQFGFDLNVSENPPLSSWDELAWQHVPLRHGLVAPRAAGGPTLAAPGPGEAAWGANPVDMARISFQRPFQVAFSPLRLIGSP